MEVAEARELTLGFVIIALGTDADASNKYYSSEQSSIMTANSMRKVCIETSQRSV